MGNDNTCIIDNASWAAAVQILKRLCEKNLGLKASKRGVVLDKDFSAVKQNKTDESATEWMDNLRQAADIQFYTGRYPEYFKNISDRMEGR